MPTGALSCSTVCRSACSTAPAAPRAARAASISPMIAQALLAQPPALRGVDGRIVAEAVAVDHADAAERARLLVGRRRADRETVLDAQTLPALRRLELHRRQLVAEEESADLAAPQRVCVLLQGGVTQPPDSRRADGVDRVLGAAAEPAGGLAARVKALCHAVANDPRRSGSDRSNLVGSCADARRQLTASVSEFFYRVDAIALSYHSTRRLLRGREEAGRWPRSARAGRGSTSPHRCRPGRLRRRRPVRRREPPACVAARS